MQTQINFSEMESRLDRIEEFVLQILKEKNPEGYAEIIDKKIQNEEENKIN